MLIQRETFSRVLRESVHKAKHNHAVPKALPSKGDRLWFFWAMSTLLDWLLDCCAHCRTLLNAGLDALKANNLWILPAHTPSQGSWVDSGLWVSSFLFPPNAFCAVPECSLPMPVLCEGLLLAAHLFLKCQPIASKAQGKVWSVGRVCSVFPSLKGASSLTF